MGIIEKLSKIQDSISLQKNDFNDFGKYNYYSFEKIMSVIKPAVKKAKCVLYMTNDLECIGDRNYIKATVVLCDLETGQTIQSSAHAREDASEKGKNGCQLTASASTYARKNALSGLFCIEGDCDIPDDEPEQDETSIVIAKAKRKAELLKFMNDTYDAAKLKDIADHYGLKSVSEMDDDDVDDYIKLLNKKGSKK